MVLQTNQLLPPLVIDCSRDQWDAGVLRDQPGVPGVPQAIIRSWQRSKKAGLDPHDTTPVPVLSPREFAARQRNSALMLQSSLGTLSLLQEAVRGTDFMVVLSDATGCVLKIMGDDGIKAKAAENKYLEGALRDCDHAGTNAISLCLDERRPVQMTGCAHFRVLHHSWTCSSAPILAPDGEMLGVCTLSGSQGTQQLHTLGLVTAAVASINGLIREFSLNEENVHLAAMVETIHSSLSEGLIALGTKGAILNMNPAACRMLGISAAECLGKNFIELACPDEGFAAWLRANRQQEGRELTLNLPSGQRQFICRLTALKKPMEGVLLSLSEKQAFLEVSRRVRGHVARFAFEDIIGATPILQRQVTLARMAAQGAERVIIAGESGTGKELFAQAMHNAGPRRNEPFVPISCPTLPAELVEGELFGHERGAFTGARREGMAGKLEQAHGGTLFLDEINSLPVGAQAKLLRAIQEREIVRVGGTKPIPVDVFIVAASNADLVESMRQGSFREDLYHRLNEVELVIPPLRERMGDIELLCEHILRRIARDKGHKPLPIAACALAALHAHNWPGNIRELENALKHASLLAHWEGARNPFIVREFLPRGVLATVGRGAGAAVRDCDLDSAQVPHAVDKGTGPAPHGTDLHAPGYAPPVRPLADADRAQLAPLPGDLGLREHSLHLLHAAVQRHAGNMTAAARSLGISRSTLYRKLGGSA